MKLLYEIEKYVWTCREFPFIMESGKRNWVNRAELFIQSMKVRSNSTAKGKQDVQDGEEDSLLDYVIQKNVKQHTTK